MGDFDTTKVNKVRLPLFRHPLRIILRIHLSKKRRSHWTRHQVETLLNPGRSEHLAPRRYFLDCRTPARCILSETCWQPAQERGKLDFSAYDLKGYDVRVQRRQPGSLDC